MSINIDQVTYTFIAESRELLEQMESALLAVAHDGPDAVNAIFRAAHTIKGSAGMFGLDPVVAFTHVAESVLDKARDGALPLDDELVALLLACRDHIGALVDAVETGTLDGNADLTEAGAPLVAALRGYLGGSGAPAPVRHTEVAGPGAAGHWHISLRFGRDVLRNGMDPLSFIRYLGQMGSITDIATVADDLPDADAFDPESCYLGFEIGFASDADKASIDAVFDFVRDDCAIGIAPRATAVAAPLVETAAAKPRQAQEARPQQETRSVRVDADKLDRLINLVGELIIAGAGANLVARRT
jgi:two-component system chemotaxis sensor kinase CheA